MSDTLSIKYAENEEVDSEQIGSSEAKICFPEALVCWWSGGVMHMNGIGWNGS
jgi:hypothetical protein